MPGTTLTPARATFIRPSPDVRSRVHLTNWPIRPPPGYPHHRLLSALLILAFIVGAGSTFIFISGPAQAQVAYDTAVESVRTLTTDPYTWSHSPVGTPRAVIVTVAHGIESTDCIVSVSYGSASMTRVTTAADTATEPVYITFALLFLNPIFTVLVVSTGALVVVIKRMRLGRDK